MGIGNFVARLLGTAVCPLPASSRSPDLPQVFTASAIGHATNFKQDAAWTATSIGSAAPAPPSH